MRELAGSFGDFGTVLPLAVGYIAVCGMNPAGLLVMMGLANIATGIVYRLPMPIEPMKVLAVVAIAQQWTPSMVYASAFSMGIIWLTLSITNIMGRIASITPGCVVRGIQVSLGALLAFQATTMLSDSWALAVISIVIVVFLRKNRYAPATVMLLALGIIIMAAKGQLTQVQFVGFSLPGFSTFHPKEIWDSLVLAGFAQIPLTATNAVIATAALITQYWPDKPVSEKKLSLNMGIMNLISPFFGGMPMCHGAGGLAGQYYFGARTGGANIIEGLIELSLGIFLSASIVSLFTFFPVAIIGAMMFLVGIELMSFARDIRFGADMIPFTITLVVSLISNMALGFLSGMAAHFLIEKFVRRKMNVRP
jgi:hypothetical protein